MKIEGAVSRESARGKMWSFSSPILAGVLSFPCLGKLGAKKIVHVPSGHQIFVVH
jgi:hypothetical protein